MQTPAEIDTKLAAIHGEYIRQLTIAAQYTEKAEKLVKWGGNPHTAERFFEQARAAERAARRKANEMLPLELEFTQRGGWTRAFIVADGHVHSTMRCSTCNNGTYPTQFGWLTEMSGLTEAEIIEAAGSRACTVCYPNAPVDAPPGRLFHEDEIASQRARAARQATRDKAAAKKAEKAIGPYRTSDRDLLDTVYKAKQYLTDGFDWGWSHPSYSPEDRDAVAALLAAKLGTTPEEQLEAAEKRAKNRG